MEFCHPFFCVGIIFGAKLDKLLQVFFINSYVQPAYPLCQLHSNIDIILGSPRIASFISV